MFKTILKRAAIGFPIGIAIGHIITIIISLNTGDGKFIAYVPEFAESLGSELGAVIIQTALCALIGAVSAGGSVIWESDRMSLAGQSLAFFALLSVTMMPVAYLTHWMEHSVKGFISYFAMFAVIFLAVWVLRYLVWKKQVAALNKDIAADK